MTDRYQFLRTAEREGRVVALIADEEKLGRAGVESLRNSFRAHATPHIRDGVLVLNADQLRERIPEMRNLGMTNSVAAYTRAIECIDKRNVPGGDPGSPGPGKDSPVRERGPSKPRPDIKPGDGKDRPDIRKP